MQTASHVEILEEYVASFILMDDKNISNRLTPNEKQHHFGKYCLSKRMEQLYAVELRRIVINTIREYVSSLSPIRCCLISLIELVD